MNEILVNKISDCTGCSACYSSCPLKCITMKPDNEGFLYPFIDEDKCKHCGKCVSVCESQKGKIQKNKSINTYAIKAKHEVKRLASSSGGVFALLANKIIDENGIVFGASFDSSWRVVHTSINNICEIDKLRGSKYVQSNVLDTYIEVQKLLISGELVYYSGTPCQIAGLKSFLCKEYDNLITQDIICHGVPSPLVWKRYLDNIVKHRCVKRISHRDKMFGWSRFSLTIDYNDGKRFCEDLTESAYLRGFLSNLYLRPSCYQCRYKGKERLSDITLADFWGCNHIAPQLYDEKGCSLVFANTSKGLEYISRILDETDWKNIDDDQIFRYNSAAMYSVKPHKNRDVFFQEFGNSKNTEKIILKLLGDSLIGKNLRVGKRKVRAKLSKIKRGVLKR